MNLTSIEQFKIDYAEKTGEMLASVVASVSNDAIKEQVFINYVESIIKEEIYARNPKFRRKEQNGLSTFQERSIWRAMLEQAYYMLTAGDFTNIIGYDPVTNTITDIKELRKRIISPLAYKILNNAGLFYSAITRTGEGSYLERRSHWGRIN